MASKRRSGFRSPELRGTLGSLLRTTTDVVRDALERGAREGRARLDDVRSNRRRHDVLADLGELVLDLIRRGEIDLAELPEARDLVQRLDDLDAGAEPARAGRGRAGDPYPPYGDERGYLDERSDDDRSSRYAAHRAPADLDEPDLDPERTLDGYPARRAPAPAHAADRDRSRDPDRDPDRALPRASSRHRFDDRPPARPGPSRGTPSPSSSFDRRPVDRPSERPGDRGSDRAPGRPTAPRATSSAHGSDSALRHPGRADPDDGTVSSGASPWSAADRSGPHDRPETPSSRAPTRPMKGTSSPGTAEPPPHDHPDSPFEAPPRRPPLVRQGGISFDDDDDLSEYMHPDDVPSKNPGDPKP